MMDATFFAELLGDRETEAIAPTSYGTENLTVDPREDDPREEPGEDSAIDLGRVLREVAR
jgi:hypothetical protein